MLVGVPYIPLLGYASLYTTAGLCLPLTVLGYASLLPVLGYASFSSLLGYASSWSLLVLYSSWSLLVLYLSWYTSPAVCPWVHLPCRTPLMAVSTSYGRAGPGSGGVTRPWALFFRPGMGRGPFDTQVSQVLFSFDSRICSSFPDEFWRMTERSDERRATWPRAGTRHTAQDGYEESSDGGI